MAAGGSASVGGGRQSVVVVDVAGNAGHVGMAIGEHEPGRAVVERRCIPTDGRMASGTVGERKSSTSGWMYRIVGLLPGRQMAAGVPAIGRRDRQRIIVADVAQIASHGRMAIGQWEAGCIVIEDPRSPGGNRVA